MFTLQVSAIISLTCSKIRAPIVENNIFKLHINKTNNSIVIVRGNKKTKSYYIILIYQFTSEIVRVHKDCIVSTFCTPKYTAIIYIYNIVKIVKN